MIAGAWIRSYLAELLEKKASVDEAFFFKAISEYTLFCFLLKRRGTLPADDKEIIKRIAEVEVSQALRGPHISYLLHSILEREVIGFEPLKPQYDSIEAYFLDCLCNNTEGDDWANVVKDFLASLATQHLDTARAYYLTHLVFFSSNFGTNGFWAALPDKITQLLVSIIQLGIQLAQDDKNWDLVQELYLALLYVSPRHKEPLRSAFEDGSMRYRSRQGWYLSDGENLEYFETHYPLLSVAQQYSLFHTTILAELLAVELGIGTAASADVSFSNPSPQAASRPHG